MHVDLARKRESQPNPVAPDRRYPYRPNGIGRIANDHLFPFTSGDHKHCRTSCPVDRAIVRDPT